MSTGRATRLAKAQREFLDLKRDKAANRAGSLSDRQDRMMNQAMAFVQQLQTAADTEVVDAAGHDRQEFAFLRQLETADLEDARSLLYDAALASDSDEGRDDGRP